MKWALLATLVFAVQLQGHSGRTDSRGGHFNRSTGEYHFHDGRYAGRQRSTSTAKKESGSNWFLYLLIAGAVVWVLIKFGSHPVSSKSPASVNHAVNTPSPVSERYYLSSTGIRHNRRCKYYRRSHPCSPSAGRRCRLCGG